MESHYEGDCLKVMQTLPSESVGMILRTLRSTLGKNTAASRTPTIARITTIGVPPGLPKGLDFKNQLGRFI